MRERAAQGLAVIGALAGGIGLVLQFVLMWGNMAENGGSPLGVVWRFLGYFTLLSNILVTVLFTHAALKPKENSERIATFEAMGATAIIFVGVVYHLLLAARWHPQGAQLIADILHHTVTPIVFPLFWLLRPHGLLKWRDALICALWPLGYAIYALVRGAFDGWYAYYFMDPTHMSVPQLALSIGGLSAAFLIGALAFVGLDKALARRSAAA